MEREIGTEYVSTMVLVLAVGEASGIVLLDPAQGLEHTVLDSIQCAHIDSSAKHIIATSAQGILRYTIERQHNDLIFPNNSHHTVSALNAGPLDRFIAVGTVQGEVVIADTRNRMVVQTYQEHKGRVNAVAFVRKDENHIISAGDDGKIIMYSKNSPRIRDTFVHNVNQLNSAKSVKVIDLRVSLHKPTWFASVGNDGRLAVWDILAQSKQCKFDHQGTPSDFVSCAFGRSEHEVLFCCDNILQILDIRSKTPVVSQHTFSSNINCIDTCGDLVAISFASLKEPLQIFDINTMKKQELSFSNLKDCKYVRIGAQELHPKIWEKLSTAKSTAEEKEGDSVESLTLKESVPLQKFKRISVISDASSVSSAFQSKKNGLLSTLALTSPFKVASKPSPFQNSVKKKLPPMVSLTQELDSMSVCDVPVSFDQLKKSTITPFGRDRRTKAAPKIPSNLDSSGIFTPARKTSLEDFETMSLRSTQSLQVPVTPYIRASPLKRTPMRPRVFVENEKSINDSTIFKSPVVKPSAPVEPVNQNQQIDASLINLNSHERLENADASISIPKSNNQSNSISIESSVPSIEKESESEKSFAASPTQATLEAILFEMREFKKQTSEEIKSLTAKVDQLVTENALLRKQLALNNLNQNQLSEVQQ